MSVFVLLCQDSYEAAALQRKLGEGARCISARAHARGLDGLPVYAYGWTDEGLRLRNTSHALRLTSVLDRSIRKAASTP